MVKRLDISELNKNYGNWTVVGDGGYIGKARRRAIQCVCVCGISRNVSMSDLINGSSKSCGCVTYGNHKHGACTNSISRLYRCWQSMKDRSRMRLGVGDECFVYEPWLTYEAFAEWAVSNGYDDGLVLCRTGDVGGYEPTNCRWDTQRSNMVELNAKKYIINDPSGNVVVIHNLSKFCRDNHLNVGLMRKVMNGINKQHKGWTRII